MWLIDLIGYGGLLYLLLTWGVEWVLNDERPQGNLGRRGIGPRLKRKGPSPSSPRLGLGQWKGKRCMSTLTLSAPLVEAPALHHLILAEADRYRRLGTAFAAGIAQVLEDTAANVTATRATNWSDHFARLEVLEADQQALWMDRGAALINPY